MHLKGRRPRGAQARRQEWVDRLQGVVPVAVPISRQRAAGHRAVGDDGQCATDVFQQRLPRGCPVVVDKGDPFAEQAGIACYCQILPERQYWPEDDIAVSISLAATELAGVELEGLGPVASRILSTEKPQDKVAQRRGLSQGDEQTHRSLPDIPGAPGSAGGLFQPSR